MTNEVQTTPGTGLAATQQGSSLTSGYDPKDLIIPRALLIQHTPPKNIELDQDIHRPGMVIDNLTLNPLPKVFVPIMVRTKWIRFNAQEESKAGFDPAFEPGAKIWESDDPLDPRVQSEGKWGPKNEPPLATKFLEFLCVFEGLEMPILVGFAKTSLMAGQQLISLARFSGQPHMFSNKYELGSKLVTNDQKQKYFVLTVKRLGAVPEDLLAYCGSIYESFARVRDLRTHDAGAEAPEAGEADKRPF